MTFRKLVAALFAVILLISLPSGCSNTNEDGLTGRSQAVGQQEDKPKMSTYAEAAKYQSQQVTKPRTGGAKTK